MNGPKRKANQINQAEAILLETIIAGENINQVISTHMLSENR